MPNKNHMSEKYISTVKSSLMTSDLSWDGGPQSAVLRLERAMIEEPLACEPWEMWRTSLNINYQRLTSPPPWRGVMMKVGEIRRYLEYENIYYSVCPCILWYRLPYRSKGSKVSRRLRKIRMIRRHLISNKLFERGSLGAVLLDDSNRSEPRGSCKTWQRANLSKQLVPYVLLSYHLIHIEDRIRLCSLVASS